LPIPTPVNAPIQEKRQALITKPYIKTDEHKRVLSPIECEVIDKYPAL